MSEKFTPGPLHLKDEKLYDEDGRYIAHVDRLPYAQLFMAAPEMFEALKIASIALDMVRGSTFCETCDDNEICETCGIYKAQLQTDAVLKKARGEE
ncbi:hypothetical protein SDC9_180583 [bioreactor metagenome]|uniref:Uncharacterized protein n=1 Tax=bioreactor metagenome TaxID=1076179 RepID=A0A645H327_9ZZZZ|nr:hypothetical protein [Cloacibacillus evryensis]MEA5034202.1 hypothetical protein [Cloacibacillus evryensis]